MWLLPIFHRVASASLRIYFRVSTAGHAVPENGPVLLVANHPNSLLDPALVALGARRPVRFLAKADLFDHPVVGWLVRGAGSIPVYRRQDDPALMQRNAQMFAAAHDALARGSAVGLFPEGISHDEPSLAPLRTGAARIALGAAALLGRDFPIIPVGLEFREKTEFRSRAHLIIGRQLDWSDLAALGEGNADAVRELTARIDAALRRTTINLESWSDAPIVELAEEVYAAELELRPDPLERVERLQRITTLLARMRGRGDSEWREIADEVKRHGRMLRWFRLTPRSLHMTPRTGRAIGWSLRRIPLAIIAASGLLVVGAILFWLPYRATGMIGNSAMKKGVSVVSTTKLISGFLIFSAWFGLLSTAVGFRWGLRAGIVTLVLLPVFFIVTIVVRESVRNAVLEARRFFRVARSAGALAELRERQRALGVKLVQLWKKEAVAQRV